MTSQRVTQGLVTDELTYDSCRLFAEPTNRPAVSPILPHSHR